jgi:hypothetical protein
VQAGKPQAIRLFSGSAMRLSEVVAMVAGEAQLEETILEGGDRTPALPLFSAL